MRIGEIMKERRGFLRISQQELAEMADVGLATVKDIERGKANPSLLTIEKICEVLGLEMTFKVKQNS